MLILGIPSLNQFDALRACIDSALSGTVAPDRVYVVDNSGGVYPPRWQDRYEGRVLAYQASHNCGVARSWNVLCGAASGDGATGIILSNDDITFAPDTIARLLEVAEANERAATVSTIEGQRFSLLWLRLAAWQAIGPFDEQFWPAYFEDKDYDHRLLLAGWEHPIAPSAVAHRGSATLKAYNEAQQTEHHRQFRRNMARFVRKWGNVPEGALWDEPYNGAPPEVSW